MAVKLKEISLGIILLILVVLVGLGYRIFKEKRKAAISKHCIEVAQEVTSRTVGKWESPDVLNQEIVESPLGFGTITKVSPGFNVWGNCIKDQQSKLWPGL